MITKWYLHELELPKNLTGDEFSELTNSKFETSFFLDKKDLIKYLIFLYLLTY